MMRVWIVNHYAGGPGIGTGWRHWELARRWRTAGIDARIITATTGIGGSPRAEPGDRVVCGVPFGFVACRPYAGNGLARAANMIGFARGAALALRELEAAWGGPPQLVLASSPQPQVLPACAAHCGPRGIRLAVEFRDLWPESLTQLGGMRTWHPFVGWCSMAVRRGIDAADMVLSPLAGIQRYLTDAGLPIRPTLVIPNGVNPDEPAANSLPKPISVALAQAQDRGRFVLLYAGALGVPNAMRQLFEAIALLPRTAQERIAVIVVGEGTQRRALEALCAPLRPGTVMFQGRLPEDQVRLLASRCDAGFIGWLNRSLYCYGTSPQKVPMMLAAGLPVIEALPTGGEALPAGVGWTCPAEQPAELSRTLLMAMETTADRLACMRIAAIRLARERWDWQQIADAARAGLGMSSGRPL
jgi:glycosyltransferase involved in cell wall biosynthesis